jgi:hypothetical protein
MIATAAANRAEKLSRRYHGESQECDQQQAGPDDSGKRLGLFVGKKTRQPRDHAGNPEIDISRPVQRHTLGGQDAVVRHVEPALPVQPVAHRQKAHDAVIVRDGHVLAHVRGDEALRRNTSASAAISVNAMTRVAQGPVSARDCISGCLALFDLVVPD